MERLADDQLTEFMNDFNDRQLPPGAEIGAGALRAAAEQRVASRPTGPKMQSVRDIQVPLGGCAARLYTWHKGLDPPRRPFPVWGQPAEI